MNSLHKWPDVSEGIRAVNSVIAQAKELGVNVLYAEVGEHLNPGDVYDAYESTSRRPVLEGEPTDEACPPLYAVFLHRCPGANPSFFPALFQQTFDERYLSGFCDGIRLLVPETAEGFSVHYLRGVYDGIMAHAAIF